MLLFHKWGTEKGIGCQSHSLKVRSDKIKKVWVLGLYIKILLLFVAYMIESCGSKPKVTLMWEAVLSQENNLTARS